MGSITPQWDDRRSIPIRSATTTRRSARQPYLATWMEAKTRPLACRRSTRTPATVATPPSGIRLWPIILRPNSTLPSATLRSSTTSTATIIRPLEMNHWPVTPAAEATPPTGSHTLYSNITGINNSAVVSFSLYQSTAGINNTASGYAALYNNSNGFSNTATGASALYKNKGSANTVFSCSFASFLQCQRTSSFGQK